MSAKGYFSDNAAVEDLFGRIKQEFHHNRDRQGHSIDDLEAYLVWYRDKSIIIEYDMNIRQHGQSWASWHNHDNDNAVQSFCVTPSCTLYMGMMTEPKGLEL